MGRIKSVEARIAVMGVLISSAVGVVYASEEFRRANKEYHTVIYDTSGRRILGPSFTVKRVDGTDDEVEMKGYGVYPFSNPHELMGLKRRQGLERAKRWLGLHCSAPKNMGATRMSEDHNPNEMSWISERATVRNFRKCVGVASLEFSQSH